MSWKRKAMLNKYDFLKFPQFLPVTQNEQDNVTMSIWVIRGPKERIVWLYLIECTHGGRSRGDHIVDKEEKGILGSKVDPLADQEIELTNCQVWWNQVLLLVQVSYSCFWSFLHNHLVTDHQISLPKSFLSTICVMSIGSGKTPVYSYEKFIQSIW